MQLKNHYATRGQVTTDRLVPAWFAPVVVLALAGAMLLTAALAHADAPTLTDKIVAVLPSLASKKDEPVDAQELAEAVAATTKDPQWAALELAVMANESALSARVARGEYRDAEADSYKDKDGTIHHRAWGLGQLHSNKLNESVWGSSDIRVQVSETSKALRRGFYQCSNYHEKLRPDWVARTVNGYAGKKCDLQWPGLDKRVATFKRTVGRL